jgi:hypothetical protein
MRPCGARSAAALAALLALAGPGCRPAATGRLELSWRLSPKCPPALAELALAPSWAGAGVGPSRQGAWVEIAATTHVVVLVPGGDPIAIASGSVPVGSYAMVYAAAPSAQARTDLGGDAAVTSHIEPIARGFTVSAGETVAIDIELVVMARSEREAASWQVFVKDAVLSARPTPAAL